MYKFKKILGLGLGVLLLNAASTAAAPARITTINHSRAIVNTIGGTNDAINYSIGSHVPVTITEDTNPTAILNSSGDIEDRDHTPLVVGESIPAGIMPSLADGSPIPAGIMPSTVYGLPIPAGIRPSIVYGLPIPARIDNRYYLPAVAPNVKLEEATNPKVEISDPVIPIPSIENEANSTVIRNNNASVIPAVNNSDNVVLPSNNQENLDTIPLFAEYCQYNATNGNLNTNILTSCSKFNKMFNLGIKAEDNVILNHLRYINWNNEDFTLKWQQSIEDSREQNPWRFKFGYAPYVITGEKSATNIDKINMLDSSYVKNRYASSVLDGYWYTGISYKLQSNLIARFNFALNSLHNVMYIIDHEDLMPGYITNILAKKYSYLVSTSLDYDWESYLNTHLNLAYINHLYYKHDFKEYLANLHHITGQISLKFNDVELYNVTVMNRLNFRSGMHITDVTADKQYYPYFGIEYQTGPKFAINIPTGWLNFIPYFLVNIPNTLNLEYYNFTDKIDYGFGLKFLITSLNKWDLNLDYGTYINHSGFVSSQFNIGFTINF